MAFKQLLSSLKKEKEDNVKKIIEEYEIGFSRNYINEFKNRFRICRLLNNKIFWQYAGKEIIT